MLSVVTPLLTILNQIKIYHWQTKSFSEHKALDSTYDALGGLIDEFVETYQGIFGRIRSASGSFVFELENLQTNSEGLMSESDLLMKVDQWIVYLKTFDQDENLKNKTDLLNIRDEMLGTLNQLKYLLTLR